VSALGRRRLEDRSLKLGELVPPVMPAWPIDRRAWHGRRPSSDRGPRAQPAARPAPRATSS